MDAKFPPARVSTRDSHVIEKLVREQHKRRHRTLARTLEALLMERFAQIELETIGRKLSPLSTPPNEPRDGRAGVASSSRRAKRPAADRSESAA